MAQGSKIKISSSLDLDRFVFLDIAKQRSETYVRFYIGIRIITLSQHIFLSSLKKHPSNKPFLSL